MKKILFFLLFAPLLLIAKSPKNIILIIGDGMGSSHAYCGYTINNGKSTLEKSSHIGLSKTYSASDYVTDSGAGATAIACGVKTYNSAIGVNRDSIPQKNITAIANENGMKTGILSVCSITHATPAAFLVHNINRENEEQIAFDIVNSNVNFIFGGGQKYFSNRSDKINLIEKLRMNGFWVLESSRYNNQKPLKEQIDPRSDKYLIFNSDSHPASFNDGRGHILSDAFIFAAEQLTNQNGFFLMIEESQIDWASHSHSKKYLEGELIDTEHLLSTVFNFAQKDTNTLIIVTADHETGGLTLEGGDFAKGTVDMDFTTFNHTGVWVPVYAFGPGSEIFSGIYENTAIFDKIKQLIELKK